MNEMCILIWNVCIYNTQRINPLGIKQLNNVKFLFNKCIIK